MFQTIERSQRDRSPAGTRPFRRKNAFIRSQNVFITILIISLLGLSASLLFIEYDRVNDSEYWATIFSSL